MTAPIKRIDSGFLCLEKGPEGYHCTERRAHKGSPHIASVVRADRITTEIVRWDVGGEVVWNKDYRGR